MVRTLLQKYSVWVDTALIACLALGMRIWGLGFDLPILYHRDEARYVTIPLQIIKTGDYNPHFFNYPTLFFYLLATVYVVYFLFMASRGQVGNLDGLVLPDQVLQNVVGKATMPSQFLVGRGVVALTGTLTVLLVYWLTRKEFGRRAALIAALWLCFSPTHIRNSHFIAPDVTMTLLAMASFAFSYLVFCEGRTRDYVLAGLLAGLAVSTKYNAYAILVPLVAAHILRESGEPLLDANILLGFLGCAAGFLVGTPYALRDLPTFLNGVAFEMRHYATQGDPGTEGQNALVWYARYLIRTEGAIPFLAGAEVLRSRVARSRRTLLFLSFPVSYMLLVSLYVVKNDRMVLAVIPFLCIFGAVLLDRLIQMLEARVTRRPVNALVGALAAIVVLSTAAWPAWQSVQIDRRFVQDDVRTQVSQWLVAELPEGSRIAGEYYSPLLLEGPLQFRWLDRAIDLPIAWYQENTDYLVLVENRFGGFYLDPARYPKEIAAYQAISSQFTLVREFHGGALGNPCRALIFKVERPGATSAGTWS
jgi:4-amino-4-deoxy-L-arabinose transferase-like glycosyltransferase